MSDPRTLAAYAATARQYAAGIPSAKNTDQEEDYANFTALLPAGARVLDLGCGPAHWAARFTRDGYRTDAVDPSPEMADYALATHGIMVTVAPFQTFTPAVSYDGIWANFSLLHIAKAQFPTQVSRLHNALRDGGVLSIGMKLGEGERRDELDRFFAYYQEDELRDLLVSTEFSILKSRRGNGYNNPDGADTFVVLTAQRQAGTEQT